MAVVRILVTNLQTAGRSSVFFEQKTDQPLIQKNSGILSTNILHTNPYVIAECAAAFLISNWLYVLWERISEFTTFLSWRK